MSRIIVRTGGRRRHPNPVLAVYRWRYELLLVALVGCLVRLGQVVHWAAPVALALTVVVVVAAWEPARRAVADRARSVVVQHRLRSAFHELCLTTWGGRMPAILWTAQSPEGLRVRLLCPAGVAAQHFTAEALATLAAACDAPEVRVEANPKHPALVTLVVVGRPPEDEK
jgi:hypothetical protein